MRFLKVATNDGIAEIVFRKGKVNALNGEVVDELRGCFQALEADADTRAVLFTGHGKFFSFGFDIPEFLSYPKEAFTTFLINFTGLYAYLFLYPKPVVAALNGHAIAGGCMLALACDRRIMAEGRARIALNEIAFGSSVFPGSTEMLRFATGSSNASAILYSGELFAAEEAMRLGLVDGVAAEQDVPLQARRIAAELASKPSPAFAHLKKLLRKPIADEWLQRESASIREFVDIWYSEQTWAQVEKIKIH